VREGRTALQPTGYDNQLEMRLYMNTMYRKCSDCGEEGRAQSESKRADICDRCWNLRKDMLSAAKNGLITQEVFVKTQKTIANSHGSGRGFRAMINALGIKPI